MFLMYDVITPQTGFRLVLLVYLPTLLVESDGHGWVRMRNGLLIVYQSSLA